MKLIRGEPDITGRVWSMAAIDLPKPTLTPYFTLGCTSRNTATNRAYRKTSGHCSTSILLSKVLRRLPLLSLQRTSRKQRSTCFWKTPKTCL